MEQVGNIESLAGAILNTIILIAQFFIYRYLKKHRYTSDESNADTIKIIADNMNKLTRSVSFMMTAAGIPDNGESAIPPGSTLPAAGEGPPLSEKEQARLRAIRKAEMFRSASRRV